MSASKVLLPALASLIVAQGVPARATAPQGEIVVEGQRTHSPVDDFVQKLTPSQNDQLSRFVEEVCPAVIGLSDDLANEVTGRIRLVASSVGTPIAKPRCSL